jgi:hypothetical protein
LWTLAIGGILVSACGAAFLGISPVVTTTDLMVDGKPIRPTKCRSGAVKGYSGVELSDEAGRLMRIDTSFKGVTFIVPGAQDLGFYWCAKVTITAQNSKINNITNIEGSATLKCENQGHTATGTVAFANCH